MRKRLVCLILAVASICLIGVAADFGYFSGPKGNGSVHDAMSSSPTLFVVLIATP